MSLIFVSDIISKINEFSVLESKRAQKRTNFISWYPNDLENNEFSVLEAK